MSVVIDSIVISWCPLTYVRGLDSKKRKNLIQLVLPLASVIYTRARHHGIIVWFATVYQSKYYNWLKR